MTYEANEYSRLDEYAYSYIQHPEQPIEPKLYREHRPDVHEVNQPCAACGDPWPCGVFDALLLGLSHSWGVRSK
ncbi:hypothetical protein RND64_05710 [Gordonia sp. w5E2]|uniref:Uncharacterized protein n=1 Tax=Gordonia jacobaea TaxID=122202 RepID=A0ABR5IG65_9ACTN|nr:MULTISPECIES: hypothetical protein [Gordonia]KNA92734.1 hypothetical protein ABW18_05580 [Gordonia jacobaea]SKY40384.1 Uncharacterised protein [Mycobacteroides abscessus subsp. abscessus]